MDTKVLLTATMLSVFAIGTLASPTAAIAQSTYLGNVGTGGETGSHTLEEALAIQAARVQVAQDNPASGSGTPYLDPESVVGAAAISGAVFGGIAGAFFVRSRSGKYAAMGRG